VVGELTEWLDNIAGILESLNQAVLISDDNDCVLYVNVVFEEMTGFGREEVVGHHIRDFYREPGDYGVILEIREKTRKAGRSREEFYLPTKDGGRLPTVLSIRSIEHPDDRRLAIATFTDISDQKAAEERLCAANILLAEHQKEIESDLALAARVQFSLEPKSLAWGAMRVDTFYHPARTIGGDFGLISPLEDRHLSVLVCDVSGHGISSALLANRIYSEATICLGSGRPLDDALRELNRFVLHDIGSPVFFITLAVARIDRDGRHMVFAGAGHPPAMIVKPGGEPRLLESRSTVLGAFPDAVAEEASCELGLESGERIVLYTDGVSDLLDSRGERLGIEGIKGLVRETALLPFDEMKRAILERLAAWRDGPPTDDISLVLVEV
jgi:sigma-B regulation protein RsbU (phosphoserine phosphatase)